MDAVNDCKPWNPQEIMSLILSGQRDLVQEVLGGELLCNSFTIQLEFNTVVRWSKQNKCITQIFHIKKGIYIKIRRIVKN